jgi:hypothetical protein
MVFDIEKAIEDRAKAKQAKKERREQVIDSSGEKGGEKTYGIFFVTEDGNSFPDYEKGISPEQAFSAAFHGRHMQKKIKLEECRVKDFETGKLFTHQGKEIE